MKRLLIAAASLLLSCSSATAQVRCYVEASVGGTFNITQLDSGGSSIETGSQNLLVSPGLGCDYYLSQPFAIGVLARYNFSNLESRQGFASVDSGDFYEVGLRGLFHFNQYVAAYGVVGVTGTDIDINAGASNFSESPTGLWLAAGLETYLDSNWALRLEYGYHNFDGLNIAQADVSTDLHTVRVGLLYKFGGVPWETSQRRPLK